MISLGGSMTRKLAVIMLISSAVTLISSSYSHADWITKARFSKRAGIDSLNRFLVLRDPDSIHIFGQLITPLGDVNNDNCSDVLISARTDTVLIYNSYLFHGGRPPDTAPQKIFRRFLYGTAVIGDINGDTYQDLGTHQFPSKDFEIHYGGPLLSDTPNGVISQIGSNATAKAVDLDNDGKSELALGTAIDGGFVNIYEIKSGKPDTIPKYIIPDTSQDFGENIATGDFNGDGYPDLAVAAYIARDSSFIKFYWGGSQFDTIPDFEIWRKFRGYGCILLPLGDFNGDGYEDILISGGDSSGIGSPQGIYFGGPNIHNHVDIVINKYTYGGYLSPVSASAAGDINHDGYPDLIIGVVNSYAYLFEAKVFLGGSGADSIPDIYLENSLIDYHEIDFGAYVAGVGDFNGDGVDDFAVRSRTMSGGPWWGEVNFFAGWNSKPVDVTYNFVRNYPTEYDLKQNFPNPFNPTTTIKFALPRHTHAKLTVYDLLGRQVAALLDRDLPAGTHRVRWDGQSDSGSPLASGIYFYRLTYDHGSLSKKMLLLK
jgi:hypothetical protein